MKPTVKLIKLTASGKYHPVIKPELGSLQIRSGRVILRKGENVGEHITNGVEELLVILEGTAEVIIHGKKTIKAMKNAAVYIPPNTRHDVRNKNSRVMRYLYITSPV